MRYVMFVCVDPEGEKYAPEEDNIGDWVEEMDRRKARILGNRLKGVDHAVTVRRRKARYWSPTVRSPRRGNGSVALTFLSVPTSTRPSRLPPSIRWPASAGSKSARVGRRNEQEKAS